MAKSSEDLPADYARADPRNKPGYPQRLWITLWMGSG